MKLRLVVGALVARVAWCYTGGDELVVKTFGSEATFVDSSYTDHWILGTSGCLPVGCSCCHNDFDSVCNSSAVAAVGTVVETVEKYADDNVESEIEDELGSS